MKIAEHEFLGSSKSGAEGGLNCYVPDYMKRVRKCNDPKMVSVRRKDGFCDGSVKTFGAVVYGKVIVNEQPIIDKSKELCSALQYSITSY